MIGTTGEPMKLIGMLDSPYVRRVAISLQRLGLDFEHQSLSVFRTFSEFQAINPVVKAPSLVCDDGQVLMDSTLILEYAEALARPRTLMPAPLRELQHDLRLIALALEDELARQPLAATHPDLRQAGITTAVAWHFTQQMLPEVVPAGDFPRLAAFSQAAEALPEFRAAPHGDGTYRQRA